MGDIVRACLVAETGASTNDEMTRLIAAILKSSEEYPGYFVEHPKVLVENLKREIFILSAKINYFESYVNERCLIRLKRDLHDRCGRLAILQQTAGVEKGD
jgi:hypothetical protein